MLVTFEFASLNKSRYLIQLLSTYNVEHLFGLGNLEIDTTQIYGIVIRVLCTGLHILYIICFTLSIIAINMQQKSLNTYFLPGVNLTNINVY